ncbi:MAG: OmpA family protein [Gammaproteobacteria bacterium]|nr:OmpA family protein [Gammaproteobacteria bacterium]MDD9818318.1 OmpA family protein [Gammaproteobacteria bacterium]
MIYNSSSARTDDEQWLPVSDLMALLMLIFMFIAIMFVRTVVDQESAFQEECDKIYRVLDAEFENDFEEWQVELLKDLTIRFKNPKLLFRPGSDEILPRFQKILALFFPRYIESVVPYKDDIREIRIEGHASSEYKDLSKEEAYFANMELSQDRTRAVLNYVLGLSNVGTDIDWARARITANGLSSSKLLNSEGRLVNEKGGKEDKVLSRRVEFRLLTTSCQKAGVGIYENQN